MTVSRADNELFALYYQDRAFVAWVTANNFQRINAENVGKYFSLHTRLVDCQIRACQTCTGMVPSWQNEQEIVDGSYAQNRCRVFEQLQREASAKEVTARTKIPPVFKDATFDNLTRIRPAALAELRQYVQDYPNVSPPGLYLYSAERRIGRTTALWCIAKALLGSYKLYTGVIVTTCAMFSENLIKDATTTWDHPLFDQARTCDLLLLDDFGQENYTKAYTEKLLAILEDRYWNARPVIVSSTRNKASWAWSEGQEPQVFSKVIDTTRLIRLDEADAELIA